MRVAFTVTALAVTVLLAIGYQHVATMSDGFSRVAEDQGLTLTSQLANATAGAGSNVVSVIPYSEQGLDGLAIFDARGHLLASGGGLGPQLRLLGDEARRVAHARRPLQQFRLGHSQVGDTLHPWSSPDTLQVTFIPQDGGTLVAAYHVGWATTKLRSTASSTALSLTGGALFICFGLMLMLGRLVTRPLARLGWEVRRLHEGVSFSRQRSPELRQLVGDIGQMHDDLARAVEESSTDPLTGIANHRAFHERLGAAVEAALASGEPLAVLALDLDHLKALNDGCGHGAGDRVIEAVAREMTAAARDEDVCARIGGDEFAVLCPGLDRAAATELGQRIAAAVRALSIARLAGVAAPGGLEPSVSFGTAELHADAVTKDALMRAADAALYEAKSNRPPVDGLAPAAASAAPAPLDDVARALCLALDAKDSDTRGHCETVAELAAETGRRLRLDAADVASLRRAALLHDAGKIGTPDAVLLKPGPLDDAERATMELHPGLGYRLLLGAGLPQREATWVLHHHEHIDGSGYPHGLRGEEIPLQSRIILVADAFQAMTADRPYRRAGTPADAVTELHRCAGRQFDPAVVEVVAAIVAEREAEDGYWSVPTPEAVA